MITLTEKVNTILPPSVRQTTPAKSKTDTVSAKDAHDALIGIGFGIVFVVLATMVAGMGPGWANSMIALMVLLILIQGLAHVSIFAAFVQNSDFLPTKQTA